VVDAHEYVVDARDGHADARVLEDRTEFIVDRLDGRDARVQHGVRWYPF
jgi:hypothetical protein